MIWRSLICSSRMLKKYFRRSKTQAKTPALHRNATTGASCKAGLWPAHSLLLIRACLPRRHAAGISGTGPLRDSRLDRVNRKKDFSGVVVSAERINVPPAAPARHAVMLQKNKMFTPHILAVATGTTVD